MPHQPPWLQLAKNHLGVREIAGQLHEPLITGYFKDAGHQAFTADEVPWCAAFVGAILKRAGYAGSGSLMARSYHEWGAPLEAPVIGAVVIFPRSSDPAAGHVGFIADYDESGLLVLGGNQQDAVTMKRYPRDMALGYRWPVLGQGIYKNALSNLLKLEGGWVDHPDDPGGATNHGITLETYARAIKAGLVVQKGETLHQALKAISASEVSNIYNEMYWQSAACPLLPAPLAAFHFDCAVNQGVSRAIRFLQQAAGAGVDGEIGPETLGKVWAEEPLQLIGRYKARRLAHYQSLKTYPIFGKGWRNRLTHAEASARNLTLPQPVQPDKETDTMTPTSTDRKWWGESLTVWGAIVTALSTLLPVLGPLFGLDISAEMIEQFGETVARLIQLFGGLTGTTMTLYGRARATGPLTRREIGLRV